MDINLLAQKYGIWQIFHYSPEQWNLIRLAAVGEGNDIGAIKWLLCLMLTFIIPIVINLFVMWIAMKLAKFGINVWQKV